MRGRVNAVDMIFIGASNQLGRVQNWPHGALVWNCARSSSGRCGNAGRDRAVDMDFPGAAPDRGRRSREHINWRMSFGKSQVIAGHRRLATGRSGDVDATLLYN